MDESAFFLLSLVLLLDSISNHRIQMIHHSLQVKGAEESKLSLKMIHRGQVNQLTGGNNFRDTFRSHSDSPAMHCLHFHKFHR